MTRFTNSFKIKLNWFWKLLAEQRKIRKIYSTSFPIERILFCYRGSWFVAIIMKQTYPRKQDRHTCIRLVFLKNYIYSPQPYHKYRPGFPRELSFLLRRWISQPTGQALLPLSVHICSCRRVDRLLRGWHLICRHRLFQTWWEGLSQHSIARGRIWSVC